MTNGNERDDMAWTPELERVAEVVDYMSNQISAAQRAAFERRLREDEEFAAFAEPFMATWEVAGRSGPPPMSQYEVHRHWERFAREHGITPPADPARDAETRLRETVQRLTQTPASPVEPPTVQQPPRDARRKQPPRTH
ncbi:MAG TPA: hypothetical protein VJ867_12195 [Gemmatimonadaceae bacterium]|nr:hypothetical protein [Gemmatimonadaceae bacterium]